MTDGDDGDYDERVFKNESAVERCELKEKRRIWIYPKTGKAYFVRMNNSSRYDGFEMGSLSMQGTGGLLKRGVVSVTGC